MTPSIDGMTSCTVPTAKRNSLMDRPRKSATHGHARPWTRCAWCAFASMNSLLRDSQTFVTKRRPCSSKPRSEMDQEIRNKLRAVVTQCRKLLEDSISQELEGKYGIFAKKDQVTADPNAVITHLTEEEQAARKDILDHFGHIKARGFKPKEALDQLVREIAFTHLNRLCAYKMMEA